jgi:hypothetical protein
MGTSRRARWILAAVAVVVLALPTSALGARFGANMSLAPQSLDPGGEVCNLGTPQPCTMIAIGVGHGPTMGRITAPFKGRITRLRVRADGPGSFRLQLARIDDVAAITPGEDEMGRVTRSGRLITFTGSSPPDPPESFRMHLRVRKGEYLAMLGTAFPAERCASELIGRNEALFQPPLRPREPFQPVFDNGSCVPLIQAVVKRVKRHRHRKRR